jgi:eukaryotic-like serine/threonine-protein kinase
VTNPDIGRDLLFGALACDAPGVDAARVSRACADWAGRGVAGSLADSLVASGCLDATARAAIESLVEDRLREIGGDARAALASAAGESFRRSLSSIVDPEIRRLLAELPDLASLHGAIDRYALDHLHAKGGLGQIWLAKDVDLDRDVALKEIRPEHAASPARWRRFLEEARLTGRLDHPGVVPIFDVGRKDGRQPFYTMRFVRGRTLSAASRGYHASDRASALEMQSLLSAFVAVCHTVAYAHSKGVIHRDLKGDNVILGDYGEVIVLDWGLAKALGERDEREAATPAGPLGASPELTEDGEIVGTPAFMAPEQAEGRVGDVDERSDVYGLGAILYEILTAQAPFAGGGTVDVLRRVRHDAPVAPRALRPKTKRALEAICLKALAKRKEDRYASAGDLARDVQRFLADEPVAAYREPLAKRAGRWARRHRALVAAAAALLVTAVVALSIGLELLAAKQHEIAQARARAEKNFGLARDAVDSYLARVAWSPDLQAHGLEPLRRQLLGTAREFYEKFLSERTGDASLNRDLASALVNLGLIDRAMVDPAPAEASYAKALEIYSQLLDRSKDSASALSDFLLVCNNFALLYSETSRPKEAEALFRRGLDIAAASPIAQTDEACLAQTANLQDNLATNYVRNGRRSEAEKAHLDGLAIRKKLAAAHPTNEEYRSALVKSDNNLAGLFANSGRAAEAEPLLREAASIDEDLTRDHPGVPEYANDLGATYNNLGGVYTLLARADDARAVHKKALAIREKLVREHPVVLDYGIALAGTYCNLGELECREGQPAAGLEWLGKAIDALGGVLEKEPKHAIAIYYSSYTESWIARALGQLGRNGEALSHWDRAIDLDAREDPAIRIGKALALARLGDHAKALPLASEAASKTLASGEDLYALAAAFAQIARAAEADASRGEAERRALADEHATRAIEALRMAAAAGHFASPAVVSALAADPDFAFLAPRPEFREFVDSLRKGK